MTKRTKAIFNCITSDVNEKYFTRTLQTKFTYLAAPYRDKGVVNSRSVLRYELTTRVFKKLIEANISVFSPLNHTHPVSLLMKDGNKYNWLALDQPILRVCDAMVILCLPGWDESMGVAQELRWFKPGGYKWDGKSVYLLDPYKTKNSVGLLLDYDSVIPVPRKETSIW